MLNCIVIETTMRFINSFRFRLIQIVERFVDRLYEQT
jgi:hypothetical protein